MFSKDNLEVFREINRLASQGKWDAIKNGPKATFCGRDTEALETYKKLVSTFSPVGNCYISMFSWLPKTPSQSTVASHTDPWFSSALKSSPSVLSSSLSVKVTNSLFRNSTDWSTSTDRSITMMNITRYRICNDER